MPLEISDIKWSYWKQKWMKTSKIRILLCYNVTLEMYHKDFIYLLYPVSYCPSPSSAPWAVLSKLVGLEGLWPGSGLPCCLWSTSPSNRDAVCLLPKWKLGALRLIVGEGIFQVVPSKLVSSSIWTTLSVVTVGICKCMSVGLHRNWF